MFPSLNRLLSELYYHTDPSSPAAQKQCRISESSLFSQNPTFNVILWYKQPLSGEMQLMGYLYRTNNNSEPDFMEKIELLGNGASNSDLTLKKLSSDDSAIYYCAASEHGAVGFLHFCTKTLSQTPIRARN